MSGEEGYTSLPDFIEMKWFIRSLATIHEINKSCCENRRCCDLINTKYFQFRRIQVSFNPAAHSTFFMAERPGRILVSGYNGILSSFQTLLPMNEQLFYQLKITYPMLHPLDSYVTTISIDVFTMIIILYVIHQAHRVTIAIDVVINLKFFIYNNEGDNGDSTTKLSFKPFYRLLKKWLIRKLIRLTWFANFQIFLFFLKGKIIWRITTKFEFYAFLLCLFTLSVFLSSSSHIVCLLLNAMNVTRKFE